MSQIETLLAEMHKGVVKFSFTKKDGSLREAEGTLNQSTIHSVYSFKGGDCPPQRYGYVSYWDTEKKDWRCFNPSNLVSIEGQV